MEAKNKYHVASISWPNKEAKTQAQKRAKALGLSLSAYINQLIMNDLQERGSLTIRECRITEDGQPLDSNHDTEGWKK